MQNYYNKSVDIYYETDNRVQVPLFDLASLDDMNGNFFNIPILSYTYGNDIHNYEFGMNAQKTNYVIPKLSVQPEEQGYSYYNVITYVNNEFGFSDNIIYNKNELYLLVPTYKDNVFDLKLIEISGNFEITVTKEISNNDYGVIRLDVVDATKKVYTTSDKSYFTISNSATWIPPLPPIEQPNIYIEINGKKWKCIEGEYYAGIIRIHGEQYFNAFGYVGTKYGTVAPKTPDIQFGYPDVGDNVKTYYSSNGVEYGYITNKIYTSEDDQTITFGYKTGLKRLSGGTDKSIPIIFIAPLSYYYNGKNYLRIVRIKVNSANYDKFSIINENTIQYNFRPVDEYTNDNQKDYIELYPESDYMNSDILTTEIKFWTPVFVQDPYENGGLSKQGGGYGSQIDKNDEFRIHKYGITAEGSLQQSALKLYRFNDTISQLRFYEALFSEKWSVEESFFKNPTDLIISKFSLPFIYESGELDTTFHLGDKNFENISVKELTTRIVKLDFGKIDFNHYYNSFLDYSPFTTIELYLPFIGFVEVKPIEIIGNYLHLIYDVDLVTGNFSANIYINDNRLAYSFNGFLSSEQPVTGGTWNEYQSILKQATTNAVSGAIGGIAAAAGLLGRRFLGRSWNWTFCGCRYFGRNSRFYCW